MTEGDRHHARPPATSVPAVEGVLPVPVAQRRWFGWLAALGLLLILASAYLAYVASLENYCVVGGSPAPCDALRTGHLPHQLTPSRSRFIELARHYDMPAYLEFMWSVDLAFPLGYGLLFGFGYAHFASRAGSRRLEALAGKVVALSLLAAGLDYFENTIITHQVLALERQGEAAVCGALVLIKSGAAWLKMALFLLTLAAFLCVLALALRARMAGWASAASGRA